MRNSCLRPFLRCCLLLLPLCVAAEEAPLTVDSPFIEMHTGPGSGFPVFHVVERGEQVSLLKQRTDWFQVRAPRGQRGWVSRRQIGTTQMAGGASFAAALARAERRRRFQVGVAGGQFAGEPAVTLSGDYQWHFLRLGAVLSDVAGRYSSTRLYYAQLGLVPSLDWPAVPGLWFGAGVFANDPRQTLVNDVASEFRDKLEADPYARNLSWMAGVDFYNRIQGIAKIPSVRILSAALSRNSGLFIKTAPPRLMSCVDP